MIDKRKIVYDNLFSIMLIFIISVLANIKYFINGESIYHINSVSSSTLYFMKMQLDNFKNLVFHPQYWSSRIYAGGPVHTGLAIYNPLLLLLVFFKTFGSAIIFYDISMKLIGGAGLYFLLKKYRFSHISALCCSLIYPLNPFGSVFGSDPQFVSVVYWLPLIILNFESLVDQLLGKTSLLLHIFLTAFTLALCYLTANIQNITHLMAFVLFPYLILRGLSLKNDKSTPHKTRIFFLASTSVFILMFLLVIFEIIPTVMVLKYGYRDITWVYYVKILIFALSLLGFSFLVQAALNTANKIARYLSPFIIISALIFSEGGRTSIYNIFVGNYFQKFQETHFIFNFYNIRYFTLLQLLLLLFIFLKRKFSKDARFILLYVAVGYFIFNFFWPHQKICLSISKYFYFAYPEYFERCAFIPLIGIMIGLAFALDEVFSKLKKRHLYFIVPLFFLILPAENYLVYMNKTLFTKGFGYLHRKCREYDFLERMNPTERMQSVYNNEHLTWKSSFYPKIMPRWLTPPYFGANIYSRVGIGVVPEYNYEYDKIALPAYFGVNESDPLTPLFNLAGVKYIFSFNKLSNDTGLKLLMKGEEYYIYQNEEAFPRIILFSNLKFLDEDKILPAMSECKNRDLLDHVYISKGDSIRMDNRGDNGAIFMNDSEFASGLGRVKISQYQNEHVEVDCDIIKECFFVITDTFFDGWKASINNKELKLVRADYIYRGVKLEPGRYKLIMRYKSKINEYALWVSFSTFIVGIFVLIISFFLSRRMSIIGD